MPEPNERRVAFPLKYWCRAFLYVIGLTLVAYYLFFQSATGRSEDLDAIYILAGGVQKTKSGTVIAGDFNSVDFHGLAGDYQSRAEAAMVYYYQKQLAGERVFMVASGTLLPIDHTTKEEVYLYEVYHRHLLTIGVSPSDIIDSPFPVCTTTEFIALIGFALKYDWKHILVVGDEYQMPRVRLLWELIQSYPLTSQEVDATVSASRDAKFLNANEHFLQEENGEDGKRENYNNSEENARKSEKRTSGESDNVQNGDGKGQLSMFARSVRFFTNRLIYRHDQLLTPDFLTQLRAFRARRVNVTFLSSRAILEDHDPSRKVEFARIYRSPSLLKRLYSERRGVQLLMNGTYYLPVG